MNISKGQPVKLPFFTFKYIEMNTVDEKLKKIDELTTDFSLSKYNFLKISTLIKLIEDTHKHAENCEQCRENEAILENLIDHIPQLNDNTYRIPYEKAFNKIRVHFHKNHGYISPYHFSARYSIWGILIAALFLTLFAILFERPHADLILVGIVFGLAVGYVLGSLKERKYRNQKKIV